MGKMEIDWGWKDCWIKGQKFINEDKFPFNEGGIEEIKWQIN